MRVLGIVVEYNPFHNGHILHIQKSKKLINPDITIAVMSSSFVQRGEPAIINKYERARMAIDHDVDLVIELPVVYSLQSADYFAKGALMLLNALGCTDICFGSENGDINEFIDIADTLQRNECDYNALVKDYLALGIRYPDACNKALSSLMNKTVTTPNDLLGLAYVKEIISMHYPIEMHCIQRTNDYHDEHLKDISSATSLRIALKEGKDVSAYLYDDTYYLKHHLFDLNDFYIYLKYKINFSSHLQNIHLVDEGIENLLKKTINQTSSLEEFIQSLTSKRYTRSRIQRMLVHILLNNTKEEIKEAMKIDYIRILGMSSAGKTYIRSIKEHTDFKIIANFSGHKHPALDIELKASTLLSLVNEEELKKEYQSIPYIKEDDVFLDK